jgi:membrane protein DedA with SNARE-associated domain
VPVVRQLISIPAGLAGMRLDRFVFFTGLGAGIWCLILTYIGYVLGRHSDVLLAAEVHRRVGQVLVYLLPALAVIAGATRWCGGDGSGENRRRGPGVSLARRWIVRGRVQE